MKGRTFITTAGLAALSSCLPGPIGQVFPAQAAESLNTVSWLGSEEDLISIRPKAPEDRRIILTQSQQSMLRLLSVVIVPGIVLVAGIVVWTRRQEVRCVFEAPWS